MKHDQQTYERIERYLKGELSDVERTEFEKELEAHAELRDELALQKSVHQLLEDSELNALDQTLSGIRSEYARPEAKQRSLKPFWYAAAAVLVLAMAYLGFFRNQSVTADELFQAYYEPYPADNIVRSDSDSLVRQAMDSALVFYDDGHYQKALELFLTQPNSNGRAAFYAGLCLLGTEQYRQALSAFMRVSEDQNSIYSQPARWYAALIYLKLEEKAQARELLQPLSELSGGKYKLLAESLLKEID